MNNYNATFIGLTCGFMLLLNACINSDYDLDKLNKTGTLPVGNIPLGNVKILSLDSILNEKLTSNLYNDSSGIFYAEYPGDFEIELPVFESPLAKEIHSEPKEIITGNTEITLPPSIPFTIVKNGRETYQMYEPSYSGEGWDIDIESVNFKTCYLQVKIRFEEVEFPDREGEDAEFRLELTFPPVLKFKEKRDNKFDLSVNIKEITEDVEYVFDPIEVEAYDYTDTDRTLRYDAFILPKENLTLITGTGKFIFHMDIITLDILPSVVYGRAELSQEITGNFDGMESFGNAFVTEDILSFENAGLLVEMNTNMGLDFYMHINELFASGNNDEYATLSVPENMYFNSPEENFYNFTSYYLAYYNDLNYRIDKFIFTDLNPVLAVKPTNISYNLTATNKTLTDKKAFFYFNEPDMEASYRLRIPFTFKEVKMNFDYILEDVFSEDLADMLFYAAGEFSVVADSVEMQLGGENNRNAQLEVFISLYKEDMEEIKLDVESAILENSSGNQPLRITFNIQDENVEDLKDARHMNFIFRITGNDISIYNTDYISIRRLKFKTTNGIKIDLD